MPGIEDPHHFLDLAFGYYLTGRFAALNTLKVAPNLIHHAVELLVKFTLLKDVPEDQRSAATESVGKRFGHNLDKLWVEYKRTVAPVDLARFDATIADLHRWERLRYGGYPDGIPVTMGFGPVRAEQVSSSPTTVEDTYNFGLDEMDDLFTSMVAASSLNPAFIGMRYAFNDQLREWYLRQNQHPMPDLFGQRLGELPEPLTPSSSEYRGRLQGLVGHWSRCWSRR